MVKELTSQVQVIENAKIDEKYYCFKHSSGLDIYIAPKNHTTAYALFSTKYGSIDSIFKQRDEAAYTVVPDGIAHFLEHKLFENEDGVDTFKRYAETGASANAYTSFDKTAYLFSCTDNFEQSLEILLDFVTHPYFTPATVEKEQGIIGQEIRMYDDNPGWQVYFSLLANMYEKHSVRLDIAGTVESISKITDEVLYKCYHTFYNLNNMALCVSGDITVEQVKKVADKVLKKAEPSDIERFDYKEPNGVKTHKTEKKLKVSKPLFCIGLKDDETGFYGDELAKKTYELSILNEMLFSRASDFYTRLYDEGKINNKFYASYEVHPQYVYMLYGGESERAEEVYNDIIAEFENKIKTGLDEKEFERSKRVFYADCVKTFDNTSSIANTLITCLFKGYDILDFPQIIASITFEDICDRLKKIFKKDNFIISIVNPID